MAGGSGTHLPAEIGGYRVVRALGQGGMGRVFEVEDPSGRRLALKLLIGIEPAQRARFARESQLLARVRHPGIVAVHASGESPAGPFLVMELVVGEPLDACLRRGPLAPQKAARIGAELASAVGTLHAHGVMHRDLKPENVLLRPDGTPVLVDFGLAWAGDVERLTRSGALLGSPYAAAPEQLRGAQPSPRADVWGLGVILFALLVGRPPFDGEGLPALMHAVLNEEPRWSAAERARVPRHLDAVLRRALQKDPARRQADAAELEAELRRFLRGEAPLARGRPWRTALAAGALVALAGGGLLLARRGGEPPAQGQAPPTAPAPPRTPPPPAPLPVRALRQAAPAEGLAGRFLPDGRLLTWSARLPWRAATRAAAVDAARGEACLWDLPPRGDPALVRRWSFLGPVEAADWHPATGLLAIVRESPAEDPGQPDLASPGQVSLHALDPGREAPPRLLYAWGSFESALRVSSLAISREGDLVVRVVQAVTREGHLRGARAEVWALSDLERPAPQRRGFVDPGEEARLLDPRFLSDARLLIAGGVDPGAVGNRLGLWDLRPCLVSAGTPEGAVIHRPLASARLEVSPAAVAPVGTVVWVGDQGGRVRAVPLSALRAGADAPVRGPPLAGSGLPTPEGQEPLSHAGPVVALLAEPDGRRLWSLSAADPPAACELRVWDAATGRELGALDGWRAPPAALDLSPDGRLLFVGGAGGGELWPVERLLQGARSRDVAAR